MDTKFGWKLQRLAKKLWFRASLYALAGLLTALFSVFFAPALPPFISAKIGADAVDNILTILASSMLTVTTFSLSIMVTAFGAATNNGTPRAAALVAEDPTTQNVLATFLGSFLFSLVGIIALSAGAYGEEGRAVLFVVTLLVIAIIVGAILRWVDHLSRLGRVGDTIDRVERSAGNALQERRKRPSLGALPASPHDLFAPDDATMIHTPQIGYLQHVDVAALDAIGKKLETRVHLLAIPGWFCDPGRALAWIAPPDNDGADVADIKTEIASAFTIGAMRSFEQDPRFGLSILSEIASRELSPAVNDPGTAIDVIGRLTRLFWLFRGPLEQDEAETPRFDHVTAPRLTLHDLFEDAFDPISRDGAGHFEIQIRLQKTFKSLAGIDADMAAEAQILSERALAWAERSVSVEDHLKRLRDMAKQVEAMSGGPQ
ncbi:putative membrane protein [Rhizobium sp. SG_E_25_P2]|uniref:DUF2254 domain-containing protein n=1 Tax=Rhizobium sp. SG_E_25_P2 TaxID=2879942 RepID=UPI0024759069|nr:DUF2254 domain-containing protein [Rhizobium sp. SG_E_25_P2]MDH6268750.1 putative membrane protein [Rhizobium sp. SG_E_25_P2]